MVDGNSTAAGPVKVGDIITGTVEHLAPYGAFVRLASGQKAMVHVSELSHRFVKKVEDVLELQQQVRAKVIKIDDKGRIDLSLKALEKPAPQRHAGGGSSAGPMDFEKKLTQFMKVSDQKIADLNTKNKDGHGGKRRGKK
jgi:S1 RNA binding domain protein